MSLCVPLVNIVCCNLIWASQVHVLTGSYLLIVWHDVLRVNTLSINNSLTYFQKDENASLGPNMNIQDATTCVTGNGRLFSELGSDRFAYFLVVTHICYLKKYTNLLSELKSLHASLHL